MKYIAVLSKSDIAIKCLSVAELSICNQLENENIVLTAPRLEFLLRLAAAESHIERSSKSVRRQHKIIS